MGVSIACTTPLPANKSNLVTEALPEPLVSLMPLFDLSAVTDSPPAVERVVLPNGIFLLVSLEPTTICLASTFSRAAGSANNPSNVFLGILLKAALVGAKTVNTAS